MFHRILITGGAGFVGSRLALALRRGWLGVQIAAFDNLRRRGSELNVSQLQKAGISFIHGDVRSPQDLATLPFQPDLILECSAEPSVLAGYGGSPDYLVQTNLSGCYHCLELARQTGAAFLFLSTSRVYPVRLLNQIHLEESESRFTLAEHQSVAGVTKCGINEQFPLTGARSLYGMTKLAAELMIEEYADAYGIPAIINRCGLLTGPGQMGKSDQGVVTLWMAAHCYGRELRYIGFGGTGKQVRDLLHIEDFADLVIDQLEHFDAYRGRTFNAGGGLACSLSLLETTKLCQEISGCTTPIGAVVENRQADIPLYISDQRAISAVRGWRPRRDARCTLSDIHEWLRAGEASLKPIFLSQWQ